MLSYQLLIFCHSAWNLYNLSLGEKLIILKQSFKVLVSHLIKHGLLYNNPLWDEGNPYHFKESLCNRNWSRLYLQICTFCYYGVCFFCKNTEENNYTIYIDKHLDRSTGWYSPSAWFCPSLFLFTAQLFPAVWAQLYRHSGTEGKRAWST